MGSGETCWNDIAIAKEMIDSLVAVDTGEHTVVIKWQLWTEPTVSPATPLSIRCFETAYSYADSLGYATTASVFDRARRKYLKWYSVPFIKIACRPWAYPLIDNMNYIVSVPDTHTGDMLSRLYDVRIMCCIDAYPAEVNDYKLRFGNRLSEGISDHTPSFDLFHKYHPAIYEKHFKLPDSTGLDSGVYAMTPTQWSEIL